MLGKHNSPSDPISRDRLHGSSVIGYSDRLDQERAASMADEGGTSGAHTDVIEPLILALKQRPRASLARVVGLFVVGTAAGLWILSRVLPASSKRTWGHPLRRLQRVLAR